MLSRYPQQKKPPRKFSRRDLEDKLDRLVSLIVRNEHPACVICFSVVNLECGHFFARFLRPVRWDMRNLATLCHRCNCVHEFDPESYREYQLNRLGPEGLAELDRLAHSSVKFTYQELLDLLAEFQEKLRRVA